MKTKFNLSITSKFIIVAAFAIFFGFLYFLNQNQYGGEIIYINSTGDKPWGIIGEGGERIYLKHGIIYAYLDDPDKEYDIVSATIHVTSKQYERMVFFDTPEAAQAAGYKPSEDFAEEYECVKHGKDWFDCWQEKNPFPVQQ